MATTLRDSPMADQVNQNDVILNRTNVALARSQRLIQSWLPVQSREQDASAGLDAQGDGDDDFQSENELAGVGSKRKADDEALPDGALRRKKLASNDRLLEQLLGKKAAQARKKEREADKAAASKSARNMFKPLDAPPKARGLEADEDEDEDEGRVAAFRSKKQTSAAMPASLADIQPKARTEGHDFGEKDQEATGNTAQPQPAAAAEDSEPEERPRQKATGSYLDEILAQKAKKKSKKKKRKASCAVPP